MPPDRSPTVDDLRAHAAWLRRLAVSLVGRGPLAEDVVQDTWAAAVGSPPLRAEAMRPWLGKVLRNFVRARARGDRNRLRREHAIAALGEPALPSPEDLLARHEALALLAEEVRALDEPYRSTVLLCYAEDLAPSEIARRHGIPAGTVRWRLKRGLDELRRRLEARHGADGRAWGLALGLGPFGAEATGASGTGAAQRAISTGKGILLMKLETKALVGVLALLALLAGGLVLKSWTPFEPSASPPGPAATDRDRNAGADLMATSPADHDGATLEGTVLNTADAPVGGATVVAVAGPARGGATRSAPVSLAITDNQGRYQLRHLSAGVYAITAAAAGSVPATRRSLIITANEALAGVDLVLAPGGHTLSGRVLDTGGGVIPGARILFDIDGRRWTEDAGTVAAAIADGAGAYRMTLPPGEHGFRAEAAGYAPERGGLLVAGNQTRDFRLNPAAVISGRVVRRDTGEPVPQAFVFTVNRRPGGTAETDGAGAFALRDLDPGEYLLGAVKEDLAGRTNGLVTVIPASAVDGVVIEVDTAASITGRVLAKDGRPIEGATVSLLERSPGRGRDARFTTYEARADNRGVYRLDGVAPGAHTVWARAKGWVAGSRRVSVGERNITGVDHELTRAGVVRGRVLDGSDHPVTGAAVRISTDIRAGHGDEAGPARTDAAGAFVLTDVTPGPIQITAEHAELGQAHLADTLAAAEEKSVVLRLGRGARIGGRVTWEDGTPAGECLVFASAWGHNLASRAITGSDGHYTVGPFPVGARVVVQVAREVSWQGENEAPLRTVAIESGRDVSGIDFSHPRPDLQISGVVLGPQGGPLANAVVTSSPGEAGARTLTAEDGRFVIDRLPKGMYRVHAQRAGLPAAELTVPAGTKDVRLRVEDGASLAGTLWREDGARSRGFVVWAQPVRTGREIPARLAQEWFDRTDGTFELTGLAPGTYDVVAVTADGLSGSLPAISVRAGEKRLGLRLSLGRGSTLTGRVVDLETRHPVADARVSLQLDDRVLEARTDAAGAFRLAELVPGSAPTLAIEAGTHLRHDGFVQVPVRGASSDIGTIPLLASQRAQLSRTSQGRAGMVLGLGPGDLPIVRNAPAGLPAGDAGIKAGDRILSVDGHDIRNADLGTVVAAIVGPPGEPLTLAIQSPGTPPRRVRLVRK